MYFSGSHPLIILYFKPRMKIHSITHTASTSTKEHKTCSSRKLHYKKTDQDPLANQREYMCALNAVKIERLLAKPFVRNVECFGDGVTRVSVWDHLIASCTYTDEIVVRSGSDVIMTGHVDGLKDIAAARNGVFIACSNRLLFYNNNIFFTNESGREKSCEEEMVEDSRMKNSYVKTAHETMTGPNMENMFCVKAKENAGNIPATKFWTFSENLNCIFAGKDTLVCSGDGFIKTINSYGKVAATMKCNESYRGVKQNNEIFFCRSQRNLDLIDEKSQSVIISERFGFKTNDIAFKDNVYFVTANEDSFVYLHDVRRLNVPVAKFVGHVNSVTSIDFVDNEIVTGSIDKTVRIFNSYDRLARDVYHSKRMLAVNAVSVYKKRFILSGSEDGNVRLWRLHASEKENMSRREKNALESNRMLKEKYYHVGDVRRIDRHRFLPKELKGRIRNETEHHKAVERKRNRVMEKKPE